MESNWVYPHQDLGEPLHVDGTPVLRPVVPIIVTDELPAMLGVLDSGSPVSVANADLFRWLGIDVDTTARGDNLPSSANSVTRMRQYWGMSSPANPTDTPEKSLAEFFAEIECGDGPSLTADDHRALVAAVRSDRERPDA